LNTNNKKTFFGRIKARPIPDFKSQNLKKFLSKYKVTKALFKKKKIIIEIGFGMGEHLIYQAKKFKHKTFIGIEPFINGQSNLAWLCNTNKLKNIYIFPGIFDKFVKKFKKFSFDEMFILFPDPWPKKRHHKRRLINNDFISIILKHAKKKSKVHFTTDNNDYFAQTKDLLSNIDKTKSFKLTKQIRKLKFKTKYHLRAERLKNRINSLEIIIH